MNFIYCVGKPNNPNWSKFQERVEEIHSSGILTNNGPMVQALEDEVCEQLNVNYCVAVSNATIGLYLSLLAMQIPKGKEVLVPSFTFIATIHAIKQAGLIPRFVDIATDYGRMSTLIDQVINKDTAAILVPNLFGLSAEPERFQTIAREKDLKLIFDSAHGLGSSFRGQWLGSFGNCEVFSLHATKIIHGFEGGLITTNDRTLNRRLRLLRNFGYDPGSPNPHGEIVSFGTNAKLSEIHAAMALTNLECKNDLINHNKKIHQAYESLLPIGFRLVSKPPSFMGSNYSYVTTICQSSERDRVIEYLIDQGTFARIYFKPCHWTIPYAKYSMTGVSLRKTSELSNRIMCLPTGLAIQTRDVEIICDQIKKGLRGAP